MELKRLSIEGSVYGEVGEAGWCDELSCTESLLPWQEYGFQGTRTQGRVLALTQRWRQSDDAALNAFTSARRTVEEGLMDASGSVNGAEG
ncbi:unnamed protein product [Symbiodinium sp. CCMP2592]|nr:unnamed protein product [Symbiodinium sp. CCMP2592]